MVKTIACIRCKRERPSGAKGYCNSCYITVRRQNDPIARKKHAERNRKYRAKNRERYNARERERNKRRKEQKRIYNRKYYKKHQEAMIAYQRKYRREHKQKAYGASQRWYFKNRKRKQKTQKQWRKDNPEKYKSMSDRANHKRRQRTEAVDCTLTGDEWLQILDEFNYHCAYCNVSLTFKTATQDHVVPVSKGGGYTKDNIVPACLSCNSRKHNKSVEEFMATF